MLSAQELDTEGVVLTITAFARSVDSNNARANASLNQKGVTDFAADTNVLA